MIWTWKINSSNGSNGKFYVLIILDDFGFKLSKIFLHSSLFLYFSSKQEKYVISSFVKYKSKFIKDFLVHLVYISLIKINSFLQDKHCISLH